MGRLRMRLFGRISPRVWLVVVVLAFWAFAQLADLRDVSGTTAYLYATSLLLGIGLFGSTFGIELAQARRHWRIIVAAVTVGVVLKALIIGVVLYLATRDPLFLVLGVAVAQIDPLSVAALMGDDRMSPRAKSILASWASFDDPMTVILAVYAAAVATDAFGVGTTTGQGVAVGGAAAYAVELAANIALAAATWVAWRTLRRRRWLLTAVLAVLAALAVWQFLMLAVALAGLFVRPARLDAVVGRITTWALFVSGALLGLLLVNGVNLLYGALLGLMAFLAQVLVAALLTRGLPTQDRLHLALAQQNGITAIILSLRLEVAFAGATAAIAPAILATNITHHVANWLADRRWRAGRGGPAPGDPPRPAPPGADPLS